MGKPAISQELLDFSWLEDEKQNVLDEETTNFSRFLLMGTIENIENVDAMIKKHLKNWDFSRLNRVDLAVLRMSAYSLMFQSEIAPSIVIDEAIGISKQFGAGDSYSFVNGVLDSIRKTLQNEAAPLKTNSPESAKDGLTRRVTLRVPVKSPS